MKRILDDLVIERAERALTTEPRPNEETKKILLELFAVLGRHKVSYHASLQIAAELLISLVYAKFRGDFIRDQDGPNLSEKGK